MKENFYVLLILFWGIFIFPKTVFACQTMAEESAESCEMNTSEDIQKQKTCDRACCKKEDPKETSEQKHDCDGSCQGNCHQVVTYFSFALPIANVDILQTIGFLYRQDNFHTFKTHTSTGFYFIWTPPNINS